MRLWQRDLARVARPARPHPHLEGRPERHARRRAPARSSDTCARPATTPRSSTSTSSGARARARRRRREPRLPEAQREGARRDRVVRRARRAPRRRRRGRRRRHAAHPRRAARARRRARRRRGLLRRPQRVRGRRSDASAARSCPTSRRRASSSSRLDAGEYDHLKGRPVVTYCTGGIRCEVLVEPDGEPRLRRGVPARGRHRPLRRDASATTASGRGRSTSSTSRGSVDFSDHAAVIGTCAVCGDATKRTRNCTDAACRTQLVVCESCGSAACALHVPSPVE